MEGTSRYIHFICLDNQLLKKTNHTFKGPHFLPTHTHSTCWHAQSSPHSVLHVTVNGKRAGNVGHVGGGHIQYEKLKGSVVAATDNEVFGCIPRVDWTLPGHASW